MENPIATIQMSSGNLIRIELFPEAAPNAVKSFLSLAQRGKFDNRQIKRVVPGFVIQPSFTSFEDPEMTYQLNGEFPANGIPNPIVFEKGTVAMGGDGEATASGSCFYFTMTEEAAQRLNGKYSAFGKVIEGFEELERIEQVPTRPVDIGKENVKVNEPIEPEIMVKITVETFGQTYGEPTIM